MSIIPQLIHEHRLEDSIYRERIVELFRICKKNRRIYDSFEKSLQTLTEEERDSEWKNLEDFIFNEVYGLAKETWIVEHLDKSFTEIKYLADLSSRKNCLHYFNTVKKYTDKIANIIQMMDPSEELLFSSRSSLAD